MQCQNGRCNSSLLLCFLRQRFTLTWCGIMTNPKCDPTEHDNQVSWNVGLDQEEPDAPLKLEPDY